MPLETYIGKRIPALMARAKTDLGEDVRIVEVNRLRRWDGSVTFELVAGDDDGCREVDRSFVTAANARLLTSSSPGKSGRGEPERVQPDRPLIVAVVGPTGSGKTTTIAKLLGNRRMFGGRRCGALSLDRFRVGALEQLRVLANLAQVPFTTVGKDGVAAALHKFADREVILVDTPGRGPRTQRESIEVDNWLAEIAPDEVHLAIPAGLNESYTARIVEQYRSRGVTHLLPTKLDELPGHWELFDLAAQLHMPMRWLTDGQEIPGDIRPASPRLQAAMAGRDQQPAFA